MLAARKSPKRRATRLRDSERTRERLLKAGYREVYRSGFQSASIDTILAATNVTKGALYYHFESKEALGHAIVDEVVATFLRNRWLMPLQPGEGKDPIGALIPQAARGNVPCVARKCCHGFAEGTVSRNSPPRRGSGGSRELSDRDGRRLRSVGEAGNHKRQNRPIR